jgi:hypothetical protein
MKPSSKSFEGHKSVRKIKYQHTIYEDGGELFTANDRPHRLDGPAFIDIDGNKFWYINGELTDCRSQEEFEKSKEYREWQLKAFT